MAKRKWSKAQRKAQADRIRAHYAAIKVAKGDKPKESEPVSLRARLISSITDLIHAMSDDALVSVHRDLSQYHGKV